MDLSTNTHGPARLDSLIARCLSDDLGTAVTEIEREGLWEYVAAHACDTGIGGALLHRLNEKNQSIPASAEDMIEAYTEHVAAANEHRRAAVAKVLAWIESAGIDFMLLKGAALNATVFDQPGTRGMVDVDVLVRPGDVAAVDEQLLDFGCTRGADLVQEDFYPRFYNEREYFTPNRPRVKIDLHARPFRPLRYLRTVPADALWDRPDRVFFGPLRVRIPNAENMLIHLAVHAACHGASQLKWLYDIKCWLEACHRDIDAARIADRCRQWQVVHAVRLALETTRDTFRGDIPGLFGILDRLPEESPWSERLVLRQAPQDTAKPVKAMLVNMLCTPGVGYRLGYLRAVLLPGRSHMGQLYHRRHPGWLLAAHVSRATKALRRPFASDPAAA